MTNADHTLSASPALHSGEIAAVAPKFAEGYAPSARCHGSRWGLPGMGQGAVHERGSSGARSRCHVSTGDEPGGHAGAERQGREWRRARCAHLPGRSRLRTVSGSGR